MSALPLTVQPLTREAFAPFGEVIEASDAVKHFTINAGNTERYHDLGKLYQKSHGDSASPIEHATDLHSTVIHIVFGDFFQDYRTVVHVVRVAQRLRDDLCFCRFFLFIAAFRL